MRRLLMFMLAAAMMGFGTARAQEDLSGVIQIKGSDTMVNLGQAWAEAFSKAHPGVSVAVTGGGSGTGFAALIGGTCDVAETSRTITAKETAMAEGKGFTPVELKVALDGVAIVVNPSNPVDGLTIDQLADIFTGRVTNWKEVGGKDMPIVILSREVNSGTHMYVKEHVIRKGGKDNFDEFSPMALLMPSSQAIADEVAQNENAIGYYGIGYVTPAQKALAVAKSADSPYVKPDVADIMSGSYPISRPLLMYTPGEPKGVVRAFLDFVLSPEGQKIVAELDFVPIKPAE
ncbi:MAG: phosphate ABC transporter substrate-binding protein [Deltaproteobacteria bacterium]